MLCHKESKVQYALTASAMGKLHVSNYLICVGLAIYYFRTIFSLKFLKSDCKFDAFKDILKVQ